MIDDKNPEDVQETDTPEADIRPADVSAADTSSAPANSPIPDRETEGADQADVPAEGPDPESDPAGGNQESLNTEGDTFPRSVVEKLRTEAAGYRTRVRELEQQLHRMQVEGTGALADASDLPFDPAHLESPEALQAAIDALIEAKPHLKARRFDPAAAAQGPKAGAAAPVDLLAALRSQL